MSNAIDKAHDDRLADAERRFEDARTLYHAESRKLREELKWRRMAEDRICKCVQLSRLTTADLEAQLVTAGRELEEVKAARAKDSHDLLVNAKERLETLHAELSETFSSDHPSDTPEYQRTLEDLVASNALLKHDTSELARTLSHTLEENRVLKDEIDELRIAPRTRSRPLSTELRPLFMRPREHGRTVSTGSNPIPAASDASRPHGHARVVSAAAAARGWHRHSSSSFASNESATSPRGEHATIVVDSRPMSPDMRPSLSGRRSSSGGIGYVHNGVPKKRRPRASVDSRRSFGIQAVEEDREREGQVGVDTNETHETRSVGSGSGASGFTASGDDSFPSDSTPASRKRASVLLPSISKLQFDTDADAAHDLPPYPHTELHTGRRTLLLLSRSMGVQTDPIPVIPEESPRVERKARRSEVDSPSKSPLAGVKSPVDHSETSSLHSHDRRTSLSGPAPSVSELVDFLTKVLTRVRGVEIGTLNRRLKKQNLPSDVGHVSRSTISTLQTEISGMRHRFRTLLDQSAISRKEFGLLLALLREVFSDLLDLQLTVNNVTLDPKLAKKLRREAFEEERKEEPVSTFWGIAAPITNYFSAPKAPEPPQPPASPSKRQQLARSTRTAPKLPASTVASTASVTVGFGPSVVHRDLPSGDVFTDDRLRSVSAPMVRPRDSSRNLKGIFAGSQPGAAVPGSLGRPPIASSRHFGSLRSASERPPRLSTIVDAVLDPAKESVVEEPLLQRRLRPRGLSDSSVHSTVILDRVKDTATSQAPSLCAPPTTAVPVPARATATVTARVAATHSVASGMLGTISRRIGLLEKKEVDSADDTPRATPDTATPGETPGATPGSGTPALSVPTAIPTIATTTTLAVCTAASGGTGTSPISRSHPRPASSEDERALDSAMAAMEAEFTPGSLSRWK